MSSGALTFQCVCLRRDYICDALDVLETKSIQNPDKKHGNIPL